MSNNAVIYARVSSTGERQSTERQVADLKRYAAASDIEVVRVYEEKASGAKIDREQLADLMGISAQQMTYITNVEAGHGLARIGGSLVPFINRLPKDTQMYRLMTTKFGE